jgi:hypothetical protein
LHRRATRHRDHARVDAPVDDDDGRPPGAKAASRSLVGGVKTAPRPFRRPSGLRRPHAMDDFLYLAIVVVALAAFVGLIRACDRIVGSGDDGRGER